ncbi:MAG TPA: branched-chain amino acid ABC transporter permease [Dermatophilaceae bacterium]|uniref:Branched-chain amino acid ABC transporter permease n=1 Tax=Candidatus Phosphoribacter hodrii TaxID=2953743 RepID=A0A934X3Z7_9MICO|nr:branched-chain amino acid ABC transporter permease [Candidatus Phosphoribacter hodrii]HNV14393.1 branched-chain amino acid ABC transporter permease [Dermatophilaceae bacterium]MBL0003602.1 branched-chain amino acid ABC transporter permease [Candidatus Phosphoribacter hodrii]HOA57794.1 branched-chain amino acid ABC transporter permease [Dermatophilaceae bacterium]HOF36869.1 branched-chain amino acid ABC transporter permease [Dermatophilaceae bacterium]
MTGFLQATVYGLLQGGLLALVAVGFSLVWGVMNVVNLSHGAFVVLGAYVGWQLNISLGLDPFLGMVIVALVLFCIGYAVQRFLINLVVNGPIFITLLLTFGLELLLVQGMNIVFTANYQSIPTSYAGNAIVLGGIQVPLGRLLAFLLAVGITVLLVKVMANTRIGMSIMATGMDRGAARLMGIRARHVYALTFGIATALAGMAGTMVGTVGTFNPAAAGGFTLLSFVIAVLGGLGNMYGAMVGGLLMGLVQAWGGYYLSGTWVNALAFLVLVIVLMFRPSGLVGKAFYAARVEV